ncbi:MAG: hypothetical protein A2081_05510 [Elusimicrobia bacterium GWC2_61_19]|nr:MAG: hypothetical protein A2081_05510 [Elusimicrobia bacterium GWC2_61_19]
MLAIKDLDHLAARLHGRRARMAEGARLYGFCGLASEAALAAALFPGAGISASAGIQRRLAEDLFAEIRGIAGALAETRAAFLEWLAARLQLENIKVMIRGIYAGAPPAEIRRLSAGPGAYGRDPAGAKSAAELLAALPPGPLRNSLERAYGLYGAAGNLFFLEAAADREYFVELLARAAVLPAPDGSAARGLAAQEADIFHLALVARGKFFHGFEAKDLLALHVPGSAISRRRFSRMLTAPDPEAAFGLAAGLVFDPAEGAAGGPEKAGWRRYVRLANRAFRGSNVDFGIAAGYAALRRLEAANLITAAEGLRLGVPAAEFRARLINSREGEGV